MVVKLKRNRKKKNKSHALLSLCFLPKAPFIRKVITQNGTSLWLSGKESTSQGRRREVDPWVGKISWRRKWQPTPVSFPEKCHGQKSLAGYSPRGHKELDMT